jgi:TolA-binding protein
VITLGFGNTLRRRFGLGRLRGTLAPVALLCLLVPAASGFASSCAYFNMFYNAKRIYREAQEAPRMKDRSVNRGTFQQYDEVIKKCELLITTYPDSKYVDDAVLLIGKALYQKEEYTDAIIKFKELKVNFPESELNEEGQLYLARSYVANNQPENAVPILRAILQAAPDGDFTEEILFYLGTTSIKIGEEEEAVAYLEQLANRYPEGDYRIEADLDIADIYAERGEYDRSLEVLDGLASTRMSSENKTRRLIKLSETYARLGRHNDALAAFEELDKQVVDQETKASLLLLKGETFVGMDSIATAVDNYRSVTASFPKSKYSAEAYFHIGVIYQEKLDSLRTAQTQFEQVPRQYANSEFATEAIKRSVSISKLLRLRKSIADGGTEGKELVQFDLAEIELFQFDNHDKALRAYEQFLVDFPASELAPKAAYAVAYIYDYVMSDTVKARAAYEAVAAQYPESQQAEYARLYLSDGVVTPRPLERLQASSEPDTTAGLGSNEEPDSSKVEKTDGSTLDGESKKTDGSEATGEAESTEDETDKADDSETDDGSE